MLKKQKQKQTSKKYTTKNAEHISTDR